MSELITAYRLWRTTNLYELTSVHVRTIVWPFGTCLRARCDLQSAHNLHMGELPHEDTSPRPCGIHAFKMLESAQKYMEEQHRLNYSAHSYSRSSSNPYQPPMETLVLGVVALGGKWQEHEDGWRAELALPLALFEGIDRVPLVAEQYGIPVIPNVEEE